VLLLSLDAIFKVNVADGNDFCTRLNGLLAAAPALSSATNDSDSELLPRRHWLLGFTKRRST
jgi:hypothetical protein